MIDKYRSAIVAAVAAATLGGLVPTASAAIPCRAVATTSSGFTQTILVTGAYTAPGASDVRLTCGVVRNGQTVARFSETMTGPVAVVEGTTNLSIGPFTACYELSVWYLDGRFTNVDYCP